MMKKIFEYPHIEIIELAHRNIMLDMKSSPNETKVTYTLHDYDIATQFKMWKGFKK